ncbi:hypothetical protein QAD02_007146 [Eretmocerus hayati]|uniref:Uncharacterized protein n=1 Tax=Eretmocerus hayati TaxID=131215 RepID=A0ACC2N2S6_9HYME|nr:hypothetical protein QAD02_007146 [Eretmocerus hayati]
MGLLIFCKRHQRSRQLIDYKDQHSDKQEYIRMNPSERNRTDRDLTRQKEHHPTYLVELYRNLPELQQKEGALLCDINNLEINIYHEHSARTEATQPPPEPKESTGISRDIRRYFFGLRDPTAPRNSHPKNNKDTTNDPNLAENGGISESCHDSCCCWTSTITPPDKL